MASLISADHLTFRFASRSFAVDGVCLSLESGTVNALIGPNGCGKSTLLRLLSGLLSPVRGQVLYRDRPLSTFPRRNLGRLIAYVPQSTSRVFPLTALEEVLTGRAPYNSPYRLETAQDRQHAEAALQLAGIPHLANRRVTELSGGERQLVAVARAFAQQTECLLLDEPASSLDLKHRATLMRTMLAMRRERALTVIMVTHDLNQLHPGFDKICAMRDGVLVAAGAPAQVLTKATLSEVYADPNLVLQRSDDRISVWSEVSPA